MPAIKNKAQTGARKAVRKKPVKSPAANSAVIARAGALTQKYTVAGAAGASVIAIALGSLLWLGGYVGLATESMDRALRSKLAAAGADIRTITLLGRRAAPLVDVEGAIGPVIGESLLHVDLDATRARLEALGWVRSAAVSRLAPNTLHVSIKERTPAAVWQMAGAMHLVDASGAVIQEVDAFEYSALPLIVGAGAPEAAAALLTGLQRHTDLFERTAALVRIGDRRWNMRLHNKTDVKLPEGDIDDALEALSVLQAAHGTLDQNLEYIDLRDPERVIAHPREALKSTGS